MLLITHPLPSDSQTAVPCRSRCCDSCKLDIKSLAGIDYDLRPTIKIGRLIYIFIIFSLGKGDLKSLHKFEIFCIV